MNNHRLEASNQFDGSLSVMQGGSSVPAVNDAPLPLFSANAVAQQKRGAESVSGPSRWMDQGSRFGPDCFNQTLGVGMDETAGASFSPALALETLRNGKLVAAVKKRNQVRTHRPNRLSQRFVRSPCFILTILFF